MTVLPKDPVILLSFTNTQLRDFYSNLGDFCNAYAVEEAYITDKLAMIGYEYSLEENRFL